MPKYVLSPIAVSDIDDIRTYIAEDNKKATKKMVEKIFYTIQHLADTPIWDINAMILLIGLYDFGASITI